MDQLHTSITVGTEDLGRRLLDIAQRDFPLHSRPFLVFAERLGVSEEAVIETFQELQAEKLIGRIGAIYKIGSTGASTLAAMAVPPERLDAVAGLVSAFPEVNHNYEREDELNLWFVVTAPDLATRDGVLDAIEGETGLEVLRLPMVEDYHLDLGFHLDWSRS